MSEMKCEIKPGWKYPSDFLNTQIDVIMGYLMYETWNKKRQIKHTIAIQSK